VHFEIPSDDTERSKKFYNELFGWKIEKWPGSEDTPEAMGYWMVTTVDDKGNEALTGGDEKTDAATARNYKFF
jgi:predicted enzyme related to lactoylglutathione lyase